MMKTNIALDKVLNVRTGGFTWHRIKKERELQISRLVKETERLKKEIGTGDEKEKLEDQQVHWWKIQNRVSARKDRLPEDIWSRKLKHCW